MPLLKGPLRHLKFMAILGFQTFPVADSFVSELRRVKRPRVLKVLCSQYTRTGTG